MGKKSKLVPKKIAGLKVPKKLRKSKVLRGLLDSDTGRAILASALTAGAGAVAAALTQDREAGTAGKAAKGNLGLLSGALHDGAGAIMQVVAGAARAALTDKPGSSSESKAAHEPRKDSAPTPDEPRH